MPSERWSSLRQLVTLFPRSSARLHHTLKRWHQTEIDDSEHFLLWDYVRQHCEKQRCKSATGEEWVCCVFESLYWIRLTPVTWEEFSFWTRLALEEAAHKPTTPIPAIEMSGFMRRRLQQHSQASLATEQEILYAVEQGFLSAQNQSLTHLVLYQWPHNFGFL